MTGNLVCNTSDNGLNVFQVIFKAKNPNIFYLKLYNFPFVFMIYDNKLIDVIKMIC